MNKTQPSGFTLIELIIVIVILGILSVIAAPRFLDLSSDARIAALQNIAGQLEATINIARIQARVDGLSPIENNPGGVQNDFLVDFGFGSAEVDFRNLCPESEAEGGDALTMLDFIELSDDLQADTTNQFTRIGYELPPLGTPTDQGCYIIYDSFGLPICTVTVVTEDC